MPTRTGEENENEKEERRERKLKLPRAYHRDGSPQLVVVGARRNAKGERGNVVVVVAVVVAVVVVRAVASGSLFNKTS